MKKNLELCCYLKKAQFGIILGTAIL